MMMVSKFTSNKLCELNFYLIYDSVELVTDDSSSVSSISHFSENVSSDLIRLADWLISQSRDEYMNVYARVRANTLTKSMTTLKEYQKTGSAGSTNMAIGQTMGSPSVVCFKLTIF